MTGALQAQQPDEIGAVGVEVLATARAVEAHARIRAGHAFVAHVAEQRSLRILAHGLAEMEAEPEVRDLDRGVDRVGRWGSRATARTRAR